MKLLIKPKTFLARLIEAWLLDQKRVLNLSDIDEFNSYSGYGYGQKTGRVISVTLIAPNRIADSGMLTLANGTPNHWVVMFDGVVIARFLRKGNAVAAIKRVLKEELSHYGDVSVSRWDLSSIDPARSAHWLSIEFQSKPSSSYGLHRH